MPHVLSCDATIPQWSTGAATAATGVQSSQTITAVGLVVRTNGRGLLCVPHRALCSQAYVVYGGYDMCVEHTTNAGAAHRTPHTTPYSISHTLPLLRCRLRAGAAPKALLQRMEWNLQAMQKLSGRPQCKGLEANPNATEAAPCMTATSFSHQSARPFWQSFPTDTIPLLRKMFKLHTAETKEAECFPFMCNTAWQFLADYKCVPEFKHQVPVRPPSPPGPGAPGDTLPQAARAPHTHRHGGISLLRVPPQGTGAVISPVGLETGQP